LLNVRRRRQGVRGETLHKKERMRKGRKLSPGPWGQTGNASNGKGKEEKRKKSHTQPKSLRRELSRNARQGETIKSQRTREEES